MASESEKFEHKLHQAIIVRTLVNRSQKVDDNFAIQSTTQQDFPKIDCVFKQIPSRNPVGDPCRQYKVFDGELVLPEYFVEFSVESDLDSLTTRVERLMVDIAYSNKLSQADMPAIVFEVARKIMDADESQHLSSDTPISLLESKYPEIVSPDSFANPPLQLTMEIFSRKSPDMAESLNLSMIPNPPCLEKFKQFDCLRILSLSHCQIQELPNLQYFPNLEQLDLSFNAITTIGAGISDVALLKTLDVSGNNIAATDSIRYLRKYLHSLSSLDLRFNPISKGKGYRQLVASSVSINTLTILDGVKVTPVEKCKVIFCLTATGGAPDVVKSSQQHRHHSEEAKTIIKCFEDYSSTQPHLFRPLSVRTQSGYGSSAAQNEFWKMTKMVHSDGHLDLNIENITTLELDSCGLFDLHDLPLNLTHLRWASFRNNNLRDVSKLTAYTRLEELSLENNEIETIDALASLASLTKLDASNNRITTVDTAGNFRSLMLLSLENNSIKNLKPFSKMSTLMEFYIGNNYITELYGIFPLKELPRLIILDLTGNQILDGASIHSKEQSLAKETYLGKLTIELLGEKIGHFSFRNISELDLRNCKIREIDCFNGNDFRNIRKLNFDNNLLGSIDPFISLLGLRCLSLNNNRIDRLLSADGPAIAGSNGWRFEAQDIGKTKALLPCLEELHLGNNNISRIADLGLYRIPQMKILYLQGNRISRIEGLEHLTGLIELVLDKNHIKVAEPSSFLPLINLKELHIKDNRLRSLSHFDCLPNLQFLFLNGNRISETTEIEKMKLPSLMELSLVANAVTRKQLYRLAVIMRFPQITCIDGKDVLDEERQRAEIFYMEQCMIREDNSGSLKMPLSIQPAPILSSSGPSVKLPIKITSVVLDGLEMKLAANSSGFGGQRQ
ncbi:Leucine-rich repeat-containing protein 9 [Blyttiomyces sp. JEL0837]|nr:Leucine-rich repeat-containing protein 9 [Blyttiomyces sp. JEL0837]